MKTRNGFGAFLLGGAIGAGIALLYAPRSGQETREMLVDEGERVAERALSSIQDAQESALTAIREARSRLEALNMETKDRLHNLQEIAHDTLDEQKQSVKKGYSRVKDEVVHEQE